MGASAPTVDGTAASAARRPPFSSPVTRPPAMDTTRSASGTRERGLVRRQEHGRAVAHGLADEAAQEVARGGIEAGVRFVEEPQGRPSCNQRGQRDPATLARRQTAGGRGAQAAGQAEAGERVVGVRRGKAQRTDGEADVFRRAELVVERGGMSQKADVAPYGRVVLGEIDPKNAGRARGDRQKPSTRAQEAGLAGAVGAHDDDDLALLEGQVDRGESGKAAGERDRGTEGDDRGHGLAHNGRGGRSRGSKRGTGPRRGRRGRSGLGG